MVKISKPVSLNLGFWTENIGQKYKGKVDLTKIDPAASFLLRAQDPFLSPNLDIIEELKAEILCGENSKNGEPKSGILEYK